MEPFVQCGFETPAILMMSLHESAMQSTDGQIRPFPVEDLFGNCGFTLKARGGFLVSALLRNGRVVPALRIISRKGNQCQVDLEKLGGEAWVYWVEDGRKLAGKETDDTDSSNKETNMDGTADFAKEKKYQMQKVGHFQKIAEFSTAAGGEYLILGKDADQIEEIYQLGSFAASKGPNQNYKRYYEASIGRENQFGRRIVY